MEQKGKIKKTPERQCLGCNEHKPKMELLRVVKTPEGEIVLDFTGKKSGRGAYLCNNLACLKKARKSKRIEQNLETSIPDELYATLETQLGQGAQ
jgi:predicted RNA-binding protein YlxR (DUF448 family)